MLVQAADLGPGPELRADVAVVGAGPAGLTCALRLAEAGLDVLLVESGSARPAPGGDDVTTARSVGRDYPLRESRAAGLGGSGLRWDIVTPLGEPFVRLHAFSALDFEARAGVPMSGWPLSAADLERHYHDAWALFGLAGAPAPVPAGPLLRQDAFVYGPARAVTQELAGAVLRHRRVRVLAGTTVTRVRTDERADAVSALDGRTEGGAPVAVRAAAFVLAGGGIENARLLLASASERHPAGIGNAADHVGRWFSEHPHVITGVLLRDRPAPEADLTVRAGQVELTRWALDPDVVRREGLLATAFSLLPRARSAPVLRRRDGSVRLGATLAAAELRRAVLTRSRPPHLAAHVARVAAAAPALARVAAAELGPRRHVVSFQTTAEQEALRDSRVRLGAGVDRFGVPLAELDWRLGDLDFRSTRRSQELVGRALADHLGGEVHGLLPDSDDWRVGVGYHHQGTTRMAASPRDGVVDPDCRVHGVRNLHVAGSSVFATGGAANPTLTIVALASRLGRHLARQLGRRVGAAG